MTQPIDLTENPPREVGGSIAANGFTYQINWALLKLVQLHAAGKDYLIFLDYHDDVVVADSEIAPSQVDFYQIKTSRTREWNLNRLTSVKPGSLSILGKLYAHRLNFPNVKGILGFVSHRHCGLEMPASLQGKNEVFLEKLNAPCKKSIIKSLREEHNLVADPICEQSLCFILSPLNIDNHSGDVRGQLSLYLDTVAPAGDYPVGTFYRALADQLRQKNDRRAIPTSMSELIEQKAVGKSDVARMIDGMMPLGRYATLWSQIATDLSPGLPLMEKREVKEGFTRYAAHRHVSSNRVAQKVKEAVRTVIEPLKNDPSIIHLDDLFTHVLPKLAKLPPSVEPAYVKGAIIFEYYNYGFEQLPPADKKSQGEAA